MKKTLLSAALLLTLTGCGNSASGAAAAASTSTDTTATDTTATDTTATDTTATDTTATDTTATDTTATDTTPIVAVDDDVIEHQLATDLKSLAITSPIETKAQLDAYLQQVVSEVSGQDLTASYKENLIDVVEEAVSDYFEITPVPADGLADDDYEDYFERNQLNNQDSSDYIEFTLASLLK